MEAMSNELSGLADNINKMEDVLDKSNELLSKYQLIYYILCYVHFLTIMSNPWENLTKSHANNFKNSILRRNCKF